MALLYGTTLELFESHTVTLDSNGNGVIERIGPVLQWEKWDVQMIQTSSTSVKQCQLIVSRGDRGSAMIAGTYSGNQDTNDTNMTLMPGNTLTFTYSGGDAGAICIITIAGDRLLKGKVAY